MINFLKNLFKEKKAEKEDVELARLEQWLDGKMASINDNLKKRINSMDNLLKEEIHATKENLDILKAAELKNPKIPHRAISIMEGNREIYIKKVNLLLDMLSIKNMGPEEANLFCNSFHNQLNEFGKSTYRTYLVLQEFFAHESSNIAQNIKKIDAIIKGIGEDIKKSPVIEFDGLKKESISLKNRICQKEQLIGDIQKIEKNHQYLLKEKEKLEKEVNEIRGCREYMDMAKLEAELEDLKRQSKEHNYVLSHTFSNIDKALRKFARNAFEDEELINGYLENPIRSLVHDKSLKIIEILKKLGNSIMENKIDIEDKKKERALKEIRNLDNDFFMSFLKRYNELDETIRQIHGKIEKCSVKDKENELNFQLSNIKNNLEIISSKRDFTKKELEKIDIEKIKNDLQGRVNRTFKSEVQIIS